MKRRGNETGESNTDIRRGDVTRSQEKAIRTLSDRLESLSADKNDIDNEKSVADDERAAEVIDVDTDLIKSELEKIASEEGSSQRDAKKDIGSLAEKPAETIAAFNLSQKSHKDPILNKIETADPASGAAVPSDRFHTAASPADAANVSGETEHTEPPAADDPDPDDHPVETWMGEEIGVPRPILDPSGYSSDAADTPVQPDLAAMATEHNYHAVAAGDDPITFSQNESDGRAELPQLAVSGETAIDLRDGMDDDYPELRSLREPPQDGMLGFYVSLALVFICSTFGTLYVLNQLDTSDENASLDQNIVAPISQAESTATSTDPSGATAPQMASAATATGSVATDKEVEHPLIAALNKASSKNAAPPMVAASTAEKPSSKFAVENISGRGGISLPINITLPTESFGQDAYLVFRGLPQGVALSGGQQRDESWAVPISELDGLSLNTPESFGRSFILEVVLIRGEDAAPETRISAVDIAPAVATNSQTAPKPAKNTPPARVASRGADEDAAAKAPTVMAAKKSGQEISERTEHKVRTLSESQEVSMLSRGDGLLDNGDIAGARLIFEYLAEQSSALGAVAFARTFDPNLFEKGNIRGPEPSTQKALRWYRRAAELGNKEALTRLNSLRSQKKIR